MSAGKRYRAVTDLPEMLSQVIINKQAGQSQTERHKLGQALAHPLP